LSDRGFIRGGARNASTRVAGKVGWPVNWWPTLLYIEIMKILRL
jgi:hypothetical protein